MLIRVYLTASRRLRPHEEGIVRSVDIPNSTSKKGLLDAVFYWGQNDFQPQQLPSVSVGDVIELPNGELHRITSIGFKQLPRGADPLELLGMDAIKEGYGFRRRYRRNPWAARDVKRHNKRCADRKACRRKWPKIANAVLRESGDKGKAIRIANWQVKRMGLRRRNPEPYGKIYHTYGKVYMCDTCGPTKRNTFRIPGLEGYYCSYCSNKEFPEVPDSLVGELGDPHESRARRRRGYDPAFSDIQYNINPWYHHNPSDEEDMKTISDTIDDLTSCDKKDWGLRKFHRNPYSTCSNCFRRYRRYY